MGLERNLSFSMGIESTYGDGGTTPTSIPVFNDCIPTFEHTKIENPVYGGSLGRNKFALGKTVAALTAKMFLKGSGSAGIASELSKILRTCGLEETITEATSVGYKPRNSSFNSGAITLNLDGTQYVLAGARAEKLTIPIEAGNPVVMEVQYKALYAAPTVVPLSGPTFADSAVVPPIAAGMALTIGGNTFIVPKFTLELVNVLDVKESVNGVASARGIQEIVQVGREYGGSFLVEVDSNNDVEFWTALTGTTEMVVASTGFGSTGNKIGVSTSTLQIEDLKPTNLNGTRMYEVKFRINKHATAASEFNLLIS
jgi:hypothetical protein